MLSARFEPSILTIERQQTYALDSMASDIDNFLISWLKIMTNCQNNMENVVSYLTPFQWR
jgi:hypothetical protein